jgi:hypothetical protein
MPSKHGRKLVALLFLAYVTATAAIPLFSPARAALLPPGSWYILGVIHGAIWGLMLVLKR